MKRSPMPNRRAPLKRTALARKPGSGLRRTAGRRVVPPAAGKPLRRTGRVNPLNRERKAREWARAYGSRERVAFVQALPCLACGARPSEVHHLGNGGMGRKASAEHTVPLCHPHHEEYHRAGEATFAARYSLDLYAAAEETHARWLAHLANA